MARIVFVQPRGELDAYGFLRMPLMGPLSLGTILKEHGHEVSVLVEGDHRALSRDGELHPSLREADVVGLSAMTPTAPRAYEIADAVHARAPGARVIIGGPHVTFLPEEALEHADVVVRGEAEPVITEALDSSGGIVQGRPVEDLDTLPIPDLGLLGRWAAKVRFMPVSTSRGCPYNCTFCSVTRMFGRRYRFRSVQAVIEEVERRVREGHRRLFFCDDNFAADRGRVIAIMEELMRRQVPVSWYAQVRAEVGLDRELVGLMARSGCGLVYVGLESANPRTLEAYNKRQSVEEMAASIQAFHEAGIGVCGMFVVGSDEDDAESLERTLRFSLQHGLEYAQFALLIPLPGTPLLEELKRKNRLVERDWRLYDGTHVVFRPLHFTCLELQKHVLSLWERFYKASTVVRRMIWRYLYRKWLRLNRSYMASLAAETAR